MNCGYDVLVNDLHHYEHDENQGVRSHGWWHSKESMLEISKIRSRINWRIWEWWSEAPSESNKAALVEALIIDQDILPLIDRPNSRFRTCQSVLDLLEERCVSLSNDPKLVENILLAAIRQDWQMEEIRSLLTDPRFNPAGSNNLDHIQHCCKAGSRILQELDIQEVMLQAGKLGLLSAKSVRKILLLAADHPIRSCISTTAWFEFCATFVLTLHKSKVFDIQDLGDRFLSTWPDTPPREVNIKMLHILWLFQCVLSSDQPSALANLLGTVASWEHGMTESAIGCNRRHVVRFLGLLPTEIVMPALFERTYRLSQIFDTPATKDTGRARPSGKDDDKMFVTWNQSSSSVKLRMEHAFTRSNDADSFTAWKDDYSLSEQTSGSEKDLWCASLTQLGLQDGFDLEFSEQVLCSWIHDTPFETSKNESPSTPASRKRLICALWTAALLVGRKSQVPDLQTKHIENLIATTYLGPSVEQQTDVLALILDDLASINLPIRPTMVKSLSIISGQFINAKAYFPALMRCLNILRTNSIDGFCDPNLFNTAHFHFPRTVQRYAEATNENLGKFERSICQVVKEIPGMGKAAVRMLNQNLALKLALAWRRPADRSGPGRSGVAELLDQEVIAGKSVANVLNIIEKIAWACARSSHSTDRTAWQQVYQVYRFVGAQLNTREMRRALWFAAAIRPRKAYLLRARWVYGIIAKHEGIDVATELVSRTHKVMRSTWWFEATRQGRLKGKENSNAQDPV